MDLGQILKGGQIPAELQSQEGVIPNVPTENTQTAGMERVGNIIVAGAVKLLEFVLPIWGMESEEGKKIRRAIANLSSLSKGIETSDILGFIKMLGDLMSTAKAPIGLGAGAPMMGAGAGGLEGLMGAGSGMGAGIGAGMEGAGPQTEAGQAGQVKLEDLLKTTR